MVGQKCRLLPAVSDASAVVVIVVRLTENITDGFADYTTLLVIVGQVVVHLRV